MATIAGANRNEWPKNFYDTGGGSFGLVPANKLQTGTTVATINIGSNGLALNGSNGTISGGGVIISPTGIIINGSPVGPVDPSLFVTVAGAQTITGEKTFSYGDIIIDTGGASTDTIYLGGPLQIIGNYSVDTSAVWQGPGLGSLRGLITSTQRGSLFFYTDNGSQSQLWLSDSLTGDGAILQDATITQPDISILGGILLASTAGIRIQSVDNARRATLKTTNLSASRNLEMPNAAGTLYVTTGTKPTTSISSGVVGQIEFDTGFLYICIAANTWRRVAVASF